MANTTGKSFEGDSMDDNMIIRIDKDLKDKFRETAEKQNPHVPKNRVVSMVVRQLMIEYVEAHSRGDK